MTITRLITSGLTIPPAAAVNAAASERRLALAAANALVPVTYGEDWVPALILNMLPRADAPGTLLVQCLWGHQLDSILQVQLNGRALPSGASVLASYTGSQATPDALLVAAFAAQGITYTDTLQGYAYSVVGLPITSFDGLLNFAARLRGRRVYDRRKDSTAGGSGSHRSADASTWEWSDNPSLCLADWIASTRYGAGQAVDLASVPAAADANDALVGSPGEKRRTIGLTLNRDGVSVATMAEALRVYAGVWLVPSGGGIRLLPDAPDAPAATYAHAAGQIAADPSLRLRDLGDIPTAVEVLYTDTSATPWRERSVVASVSGAGTTLPWRLSSVRLPGVQRYSQAVREAEERRDKLYSRNLEFELEVFDIGIRHQVGDIVAVTHPVGLSSKAMRVVDVQMPGPGRWLLDLREHDTSSYSSAVPADPGTTTSDTLIADGPAPALLGLAGSVTRGSILWRWDPPLSTAGYSYTEVRATDADWGASSPAPLFRGAGTSYGEPPAALGTVTRYARHFGPRGNSSATTASASVTVDATHLVNGGVAGYWVDREKGAVVFAAGEIGSDVANQLVAAADLADTLGYWLELPPWEVYFSRAFRCNKIRGVRGKSVLVPAIDGFDTSATFANEFIITNRNFTQGFDPLTADDCAYVNFGVRIQMRRSIGCIALGGTKRSLFQGLHLRAVRTLVAGVPQPVSSLIDYYCTNRNGVVYDCDLDNTTGAYGTGGRLSPDGGACIWVRNFRGGTVGQAEEYVSERIEIHGNRMDHMTSDECISVYGITGIIRKVKVHDNVIKGHPTIGGTHHGSFISIFPLRFNSGGAVPALDALGATAAAYQCDLYNNDIEDAAAVYDVVRIGRTEDANNPCYDNKSWNNRVRWVRSNDPVTGPKAVWVAEGSPGGSALDPDIVSTAIKCQDGNFGAGYFKDTSGNTSTDDTVISDGGAAVNFGFQGFQRLTSPETLGNVYIGVGNCRFVFGGKVESAAHCFFNSRSVVGTNYRCNLPGGAVFYVNEGVGGIYGFKDTVGESFGRLVLVDGAAPANVVVAVLGNDAVMSTQAGGAGADDYAILENNSSTGATIRARNNSTRGTSLAITAGAGTINRVSNDWNGTTD